MLDGVLHMASLADFAHGQLQAEIAARLLAALGDDPELVVATKAGVFLDDDDYRVPDIIVCARSDTSERGAEAPLGPQSLAVEILSPDDETFDKFGFYDRRGVAQILVVDPEAGFTLYDNSEQTGTYRAVRPNESGAPVHTVVAGDDLLVPTDGTLELRR